MRRIVLNTLIANVNDFKREQEKLAFTAVFSSKEQRSRLERELEIRYEESRRLLNNRKLIKRNIFL